MILHGANPAAKGAGEAEGQPLTYDNVPRELSPWAGLTHWRLGSASSSCARAWPGSGALRLWVAPAQPRLEGAAVTCRHVAVWLISPGRPGVSLCLRTRCSGLQRTRVHPSAQT